MTPRTPAIVMTPVESDEAPGVRLRRTVGSDKLILLDPFLLLDHMAVGPGGTERLGFPRHPHRGIETLTYVVAGTVSHEDSMGNVDTVGAGESQWMTAGAGLFHAEAIATGDDGHEGFQFWFNLPAAGKFAPPAYRAAHRDQIPEVRVNGATVRVVAGELLGATGPFVGIACRPTIAEVRLAPGSSVALPIAAGMTAFAYVFAGAADFGRGAVEAVRLAIFGDGDTVAATAGEGGARFLLAAGWPFGEPVLQYRSLVMTTVEQMGEALDDLERGTFARHS